MSRLCPAERQLAQQYPTIPWLEPRSTRVAVGGHYMTCRLCTALYGLRAKDLSFKPTCASTTPTVVRALGMIAAIGFGWGALWRAAGFNLLASGASGVLVGLACVLVTRA
jgi:hypothetical protein